MPTFDTPQPITAVIDVTLGDVRVGAGERGTTTVDVRPSDPANEQDVRAAEMTRVEYADRRLGVRAPKLRQWLSRSGAGSVDVTIELPAGSSVEGGAASADFRCDGPLGDCRLRTGLGHLRVDQAATVVLKTGAGDIDVERVGGAAEITTGSGEVRARELGATAVVKNSNGDTWLATVGGELRVNAANGRIAVERPRANVVAKTANGDVRLGEVARGTAVLHSQVGDLEVGIAQGTVAWLDLDAAAGKVHNALAAAERPAAGADTVEVRARTSLGDIVVRRPAAAR